MTPEIQALREQVWLSEPWHAVLLPASERQQAREEWRAGLGDRCGVFDAQLELLRKLEPEPPPGLDGEVLPCFRHPLSGKVLMGPMEAPRWNTADVLRAITEDPKPGLDLRLWCQRILRESKPANAWPVEWLPGRLDAPYYTIWHKLAVLSALVVAKREGKQAGLLSFRLAGAQAFIDQSRTAADFRAGSMILSHLCKGVADHLAEKFGSECLLFPGSMPTGRNTSFPNSILAIVPYEKTVGTKANEAFEITWADVEGKCFEALKESFPKAGDLESTWKKQCRSSSVFETYWTLTPLEDDYKNAYSRASRAIESRKLLRNFEQAEGESGTKCQMDGWRSALSVGDEKLLKLFWKGMADLKIDGLPHRFRKNERLSAVAIARRLAPKVSFSSTSFPSTASVAVRPFLSDLLPHRNALTVELKAFVKGLQDLHEALGVKALSHSPYPASLFGSDDEGRFLSKIDGDWWYETSYAADVLEREYPSAKAFEQVRKAALAAYGALRDQWRDLKVKDPSRYLALVAADSDEVGKWISGDKLPRWKESVHPTLADSYEQTKASALDARRPAGILTHLALSECLGNLGPYLKRTHIESDALGTLIYFGGDDCLAFLPARNLASVMDRLAGAFQHETNGSLLLPGGAFSVSVAAYMTPHSDPLSGVIRETRLALKSHAKERLGREAGVITVRRQSGQETVSGSKWVNAAGDRLFPALQELLDKMESSRFISHVTEFSKSIDSGIDAGYLNKLAYSLVKRSNKDDASSKMLAPLSIIVQAAAEQESSGAGTATWKRLEEFLLLVRFLRRQDGN